MLKNCTRVVPQGFSASQTRQIHTTNPKFKRTPAAVRGHWFGGKKQKGGVRELERDVINGVQLPHNHPKLRFSYLGKHKYEWDRTEPIRPWDLAELAKPHLGQYERSSGDQFEYSEKCGYQLDVQNKGEVVKQDEERRLNHEEVFGDRSLEKRISRRLSPYPTSFVDPLVWRFIEKIKLCRHTGVDRAFDIMVNTFKYIKIHQMQLKKANPKQKIELDCNEILKQAVINVSPPVRIEFVQVMRTRDGYKPCPIPLTIEESTDLAIKRFKVQSKRFKTRVPVEPMILANLIIESYNKRGALHDALVEDTILGEKYQDMFQRFGRVTHSSETKTRAKYREQTHIHDMMHVTLPLENDDYSKLPGDPQWNDDDHLDDEDKRDSPLRAGIGPYPSS